MAPHDAQHGVLTFDAITVRSGVRWTGEGGQEMFDVTLDGAPATVVPTRMHAPGWYIRSRNGEGTYWNIREVEQLRRHCDTGRVSVTIDG